MISLRSDILLTFVWPLLLLTLMTTPTPQAHADDASLARRVQDVLPEHVGAAVLVIDGGEVLLRYTDGVSQVGSDTPITSATNFRIASITKQFTATAVMLLVDEGKLSLDDTLDRYFPGFPGYGKQITVRHVLNHRSGLPDYEDLVPENTTLQVHDRDVLKIILDTDKPLFEPGSDYKYSNTGYSLLALIVEQVADQPFHSFVKDRIFKPCGMDRSVVFVRGLNEAPTRAFGHTKQDGKWTRDDQSVTSAVLGDGGVYSSIDDLAKWVTALDNKQLLSDTAYQQMFAPVPTGDETIGYGFGWRIDTFKGEPRIHHTGGTRGFSLCLQRFPGRRAAIIVLFNSNADEPMTGIAERVAEVALFAEPAE